MRTDRSPRWKYQGLWRVRFLDPAWGERRAVVAYYPERKEYHVAVMGIAITPAWMSDKAIGRWLHMHHGLRIHR